MSVCNADKQKLELLYNMPHISLLVTALTVLFGGIKKDGGTLFDKIGSTTSNYIWLKLFTILCLNYILKLYC